MIEIKHIRQTNDGFNWKCGAACLEMVFSYYNIAKKQDEIWEATNSSRRTGVGQKFILTHDLARYSCETGLPATIYKAYEYKWSDLLDQLADHQIPAILSLRQKKSGQSHFIVYIGKKKNCYCFCDPDEKRDIVTYDFITMIDIWRPQPFIDVAGYILICFGEKEDTVICGSCHRELPIVHKWIKGYSRAVICPYCDGFV